MRRAIPMTLSLILATALVAQAGTFDRSRIAPDLGLDDLTRGVAREQLGRDLFADPWATVTIGSVDVYDVFPYLETRTFQVVSDPRWNRLVYGEPGRSLRAYDGTGKPFGALSEPRGLAVDEQNRVYVADAGNHRVLVLEAASEFGDMGLSPRYDIRGLARPHDVAYSDGGTPFTPGDDFLYVADTGRNRIVAYALEATGARKIAEVGELGGGRGRFAGPIAVATGRAGGASTRDVYVADAHTRRVVHLRHEAGGLAWVSEARHDADVLTSLDTDEWGNLYAAAPNRGLVRKFGADLSPVAELQGLTRPKSFHVPFFTVRDHRDGRVWRAGRPQGLTVAQWTDASGMSLWSLGVEVSALAVEADERPTARFTLTDRASVTLEIADASSGRTLARRSVGALGAGIHSLPLRDEDLAATAGAGDLLLRLRAASSYSGGPTAVAQTGFRLSGGAVVPPSQPMLLGNAPNPMVSFTRIAFVLPAGSDAVSLRLFDTLGRTVRTFRQPFATGRNEVVWDGRNEAGASVPAGVYFCGLQVGDRQLTQRMIRVR